MVKSGLIFGAISFVLILGFTLISPICAPCLGLFLGLAAGYVAGAYGRPVSSGESVRLGGIAGLIAGALGLIGEILGGIINVFTVNAAAVQNIYKTFGMPVTLTQAQVTTYQLVGAGCVGAFNVLWMAVLGIAGGALWYQIRGKNQPVTIIPPQQPTPPSS